MEGLNILLVEDNEGDIFLIREAFEEIKSKNNLEVVKNGEAALNFLSNSDKCKDKKLPDLIIMDINIPKINGHEVLEKVKRNSNWKHIPIIILTTSSSKLDILKSYEKMANCHIVKPNEGEEFSQVIQNIENFWTNTVILPPKKD
jgi:CheY-like chemotaxis protein